MAPSLCMFCICGSIRVADNDSNVIAVLFFLSSPVYVTQLRRNAAGVGLVFEADLDTAEHSSLWVLQVQHCACVTEPMRFHRVPIFLMQFCRGLRFVSTSLTKFHLLNLQTVNLIDAASNFGKNAWGCDTHSKKTFSELTMIHPLHSQLICISDIIAPLLHQGAGRQPH